MRWGRVRQKAGIHQLLVRPLHTARVVHPAEVGQLLLVAFVDCGRLVAMGFVALARDFGGFDFTCSLEDEAEEDDD